MLTKSKWPPRQADQHLVAPPLLAEQLLLVFDGVGQEPGLQAAEVQSSVFRPAGECVHVGERRGRVATWSTSQTVLRPSNTPTSSRWHSRPANGPSSSRHVGSAFENQSFENSDAGGLVAGAAGVRVSASDRWNV